MRKIIFYSVLFMLSMTSCEKEYNPDIPPYVATALIQFKSASGEFLSDNVAVKKIDGIDLSDYMDPATYMAKVKVKVDGEVVESGWMGNIAVGRDKGQHKFLGMQFGFLKRESLDYVIDVEFYCSDIFGDETYRTMTFSYTIGEKRSIVMNECFFEGVKGVVGVIEEGTYPQYDTPVITFSVP